MPAAETDNWDAKARGRLRDAARKFGTQDALAEAAQIPKPTLQKILSGTGDPGVSRIAKLCDVLGLSLDYVMTGGDAGGEHGGVPHAVRASDEREHDIVRVPLFDVAASAGPGAIPFSEEPALYFPFNANWIRDNFRRPHRLCLITVRGDSQEPHIRDGDLLMLDQERNHGEGFFVVRLHDAVLVKRIQFLSGNKLRLISSNPAYDPIEIDPEFERDGFRLIGKVVWVARPVH